MTLKHRLDRLERVEAKSEETTITVEVVNWFDDWKAGKTRLEPGGIYVKAAGEVYHGKDYEGGRYECKKPD